MSGNQNVMETLASFNDYEFIWTVKNFRKTPDVFQGPVFLPIPGCSWRFHFKMKFCTDSNGYGHIFLYLCNIDASDKEIHLKCNFVYQNSDGKVIQSVTTFLNNIKEATNLTCSSFNGARFKPTFGDKFQILDDDKLILKGTLTFSGYFTQSTITKQPINASSDNHLKEVLEVFKTMYINSVESDITFLVEGKSIRAHKGIIVSRSPVFAKMFAHDMQEKRSNNIVIKDIDHHVLDCFLLFLYTGEVEDKNWETVLKLYSLADKYQVKSLQQVCSQILSDGLKEDSACSVLVLSYLHSDAELKKITINFIRGCFNAVGKTTEWLDIVATKPQLASEVFSALTASFAK